MPKALPDRVRGGDELTEGEWRWFNDVPETAEERWDREQRRRAGDHEELAKPRDWWTNYKLFANRDLGDGEDGYAEQRWHEVRDAVLRSWVQQLPGTRPASAWRFRDLGEPRPNEATWEALDRLSLWLPGERERAVAMFGPLRRRAETTRAPLHPHFDRRGRRR
jgi:hypothetical protein